MRIIYRYLLGEIVSASFASIGVLTSLIILADAFKRIAKVMVDNDIPFWMVMEMIALLSPQVMTFTIPWGLLVGTLLVFGRMSHNREILIIRSSGLGLVPLIAPVVLFSIFMCLLCFFNNAIIAPKCMGKFKQMLIEIGRNNPTMLIRAQEPIKIDKYIMYVDEKHSNVIEGVHIWELDDKTKIPKRSMRADRGIINADLQEMKLFITLINCRQEERLASDPSDLSKIHYAGSASQWPLSMGLGDSFNPDRLRTNIGIMTAGEIYKHIFARNDDKELNFTPLFTELQKRVSFAIACFTFVFLAIPLAITTGRAETSIGFVISVGIVVLYYLMILFAMSLKNNPDAYPDLIIWVPNIIFQALGFWLIWKTNKHPA